MMKRTLVLSTLVLACTTALAQGANEPSSYGTAQLGSLKVTSGVVLGPTRVEMGAKWQDTRVSCKVTRKLRVKAEIYISPVSGSGSTRQIARSRSFPVPNCSEGGPEGFTISARAVKSACPNGAWKPGNYQFFATGSEPRKKLEANAGLIWNRRGRCSAS